MCGDEIEIEWQMAGCVICHAFHNEARDEIDSPLPTDQPLCGFTRISAVLFDPFQRRDNARSKCAG
jgi:hypothetical protein